MESKINVADAKRAFSDLLGRVAYGRETIVITRRGRPMAKLVPIQEQQPQGNELVNVEGWLDEDDAYFEIMDEIVANRQRHVPRALKNKRARKN
jgi:prevent-host-death family protein